MAELKDANTNPWYVLMTLYGEQTGEEVDWELHDKNRRVWNAWACQDLSDEDAAALAAKAQVDVAETRGWAEMEADVNERFQQEMKQRADVDQATLPDPRDVVNCQEIQFFKTVVLRNCIFTSGANFDLAIFTEGAHCPFVTFTQDAYFSYVTFAQGVNFYSATFTKEVHFDSATFIKDADFYSATFSGFAIFTSANFGTVEINASCHPEFNGCHFEKPTSFRVAVFHDRYPSLKGAVLHDQTLFTATPTCWPQTAQDDAVGAKEACAIIRHAVAKQGLPEEEHFFFRREMHFAGQFGGFLARLPYRAFGIVSNYGYSIMRPAVGLALLWILPALIFKGVRDEGASVMARMLHGLEALGFSFSNIFKFLGFQRTYFGPDYIAQLTTGLKLLSATQTVLGFILLFFLGLGLRTRFRMR